MNKNDLSFLLRIFIGAPIIISAIMGLAILMFYALLFIGMPKIAAFMVMILSGVIWASAIFYVLESK